MASDKGQRERKRYRGFFDMPDDVLLSFCDEWSRRVAHSAKHHEKETLLPFHREHVAQ